MSNSQLTSKAKSLGSSPSEIRQEEVGLLSKQQTAEKSRLTAEATLPEEKRRQIQAEGENIYSTLAEANKGGRERAYARAAKMGIQNHEIIDRILDAEPAVGKKLAGGVLDLHSSGLTVEGAQTAKQLESRAREVYAIGLRTGSISYDESGQIQFGTNAASCSPTSHKAKPFGPDVLQSMLENHEILADGAGVTRANLRDQDRSYRTVRNYNNRLNPYFQSAILPPNKEASESNLKTFGAYNSAVTALRSAEKQMLSRMDAIESGVEPATVVWRDAPDKTRIDVAGKRTQFSALQEEHNAQSRQLEARHTAEKQQETKEYARLMRDWDRSGRSPTFRQRPAEDHSPSLKPPSSLYIPKGDEYSQIDIGVFQGGINRANGNDFGYFVAKSFYASDREKQQTAHIRGEGGYVEHARAGLNIVVDDLKERLLANAGNPVATKAQEHLQQIASSLNGGLAQQLGLSAADVKQLLNPETDNLPGKSGVTIARERREAERKAAEAGSLTTGVKTNRDGSNHSTGPKNIDEAYTVWRKSFVQNESKSDDQLIEKAVKNANESQLRALLEKAKASSAIETKQESHDHFVSILTKALEKKTASAV